MFIRLSKIKRKGLEIVLLEITSPPNTSLVSIGLFVSKLTISFQPSPNTFSILLSKITDRSALSEVHDHTTTRGGRAVVALAQGTTQFRFSS